MLFPEFVVEFAGEAGKIDRGVLFLHRDLNSPVVPITGNHVDVEVGDGLPRGFPDVGEDVDPFRVQ